MSHRIIIIIAVAASAVTVLLPNRAEASHHHHCAEVSRIVGHQQCSRFGTSWRLNPYLPALKVDVGFIARSFVMSYERTGRGSIDDRMVQYRVMSPDGPGRTMITAFRERTGVRLGGPVYAGLDFELGHVVSAPRSVVEVADGNDPATLVAGSSLFLAFGGTLGVGDRIGLLGLAAELGAGGRDVTIAIDRRGSGAAVAGGYAGAGFIEARVRVDYWVNPWATVGGFVGADLVGSSGRMAGISLTAHARAYEGR